MKILIVCDSFKETFSTFQVNQIICDVIYDNVPNINCTQIPISDGGEYALEVTMQKKGGIREQIDTTNAIGIPINSDILICDDFILVEAQKIIGLNQIPIEKRNPMYTTTLGLGNVIKFVKNHHPNRKLIVTLGGSATCDAGIGMLKGLGFKFYDVNKNELIPNGESLKYINDILIPNDFSSYPDLYVLTDVKNKLYGKHGAAYTFAYQKGANDLEVKHLDEGLMNLSNIFKNKMHIDLQGITGGGSAGGLGACLAGILGAKLISGVDWFSEMLDLEDEIKNSDIIISGEGRLDKSTWDGKVINYLSIMTKKYNKQLYVVCGSIDDDIDYHINKGVNRIFPCFDKKVSLQEIKENANNELINTVKSRTCPAIIEFLKK